jgi:hypothetical protein
MLTQKDLQMLGQPMGGVTAMHWYKPGGEKEIRDAYQKFPCELNNYQLGNKGEFELLLQGIWNVIFQWDNTCIGGPEMDAEIRALYSQTFDAFIQCMQKCAQSSNDYEIEASKTVLYSGCIYRILCDIDKNQISYNDAYFSYSTCPHVPGLENHQKYCGVIATTNTQSGINIAGVYKVYNELQPTKCSCREYEHEVIFPMKQADIQQLIEFNDAQLLNGDWIKGE